MDVKYCHVLSDYRRVLDCQLDLLGLNTVTLYYTSQLNTAAATLLASPAITYYSLQSDCCLNSELYS
jgi:hypothetical protein